MPNCVDDGFVEREVAEMADAVVAKTANRSVVEVMNEFSRLADFHREGHPGDGLVGCRCGSRRCRAVRCSAATARRTAS